MNFPAWTRAGVAAACMGLSGLVATPALAAEPADLIFSKVTPAFRERAFMRLSYISANVKTTSGEAYDVTGPVLAKGDIVKYLGNQGGAYTGASTRGRNKYDFLGAQLDNALMLDATQGNCPQEIVGLGTPCGIRARAASMVGTPAVSVGYYLDDELSWVVEAFVLAAPLKVDVYGDGASGLSGQQILKTKLLPPTAVLSKYFGSKTDRLRPFVGLGASYAIFFDTQATNFLNTYEGGKTSVTLTNSLGIGPFAGFKAQLDDDWHVNLSVGKLRYKTEATLITRDTVIDGNSQVLNDYGPNAVNAIAAGNRASGVPANATTGTPGGVTTLMCDFANAKYGNSTCNQGTYVRKQNTVLDNTLFTLGVGRSF